jgi:hypothetical protein
MTRPKAKFEVKDALLAVSILVTVLLGIINFRQARTASNFDAKLKTAQQKFDEDLKNAQFKLELESRRPRVTQGYLIVSGRVLKQLASSSHERLAIDGFPNPQIVDTPLVRKAVDRVAQTNALMILDDISVEFLAFTNSGKSRADMLSLRLGSGDQLDLGAVEPNSTKLLAMEVRTFHRGEQWRENRRVDQFEYSFKQLENSKISENIRPKVAASMIPSVGSFGSAAAAEAGSTSEPSLGSPKEVHP